MDGDPFLVDLIVNDIHVNSRLDIRLCCPLQAVHYGFRVVVVVGFDIGRVSHWRISQSAVLQET